MAGRTLIYGAYGYTGKLITELAVGEGLKPVVAGRTIGPLEELCSHYEDGAVEKRCFALDDDAVIDQSLDDVDVVIHCAGPFSRTAVPMAKGCIRKKTHYLDITGEIEVFEALHDLDAKAKDAKVMLMPGAGFDVVPSDCLAAHLKRRLPEATSLTLALTMSSKPSRGTATTMIENIHKGGLIRKDGKLTEVPSAWQSKSIDFGEGPVDCITIPWGDVSTAYYSTGIPNIKVFMATPPELRRMAIFSRYFGFVLASGPVQRFLKSQIQKQPPGPDEEQRETGYGLLWGRAEDDGGNGVESRLRTPEGYTLTAATALGIAKRVLDGAAPAGFQTPSMAYGPDLILEFDGVTREDL